MDDLDVQIVELLRKHGPLYYGELARTLYVCERTIRRRMAAMQEKGIIRLVAIPNPVLFGYQAWAMIGATLEPGLSMSVVQRLAVHPKVYSVSYMLGRFDLVLSAFFRDIEELSAFHQTELSQIPGILSTETMVLLRPRKYFSFTWPARANVTTPAHRIDRDDVRILGILQQDALARTKTMAQTLSLSEAVIRRRMRSMLENDVYTVGVPVDLLQTPVNRVSATIGLTVSQRTPDSVIDDVIDHPAVYLAAVTAGRFNAILAVHVRTISALNAFVQDELPRVKGLNTFECLLHGHSFKYHSPVLQDQAEGLSP